MSEPTATPTDDAGDMSVGDRVATNGARVLVEEEAIEVEYPEEGEDEEDAPGVLAEEIEQEVDALVAEAERIAALPPAGEDQPRGYVTNARNAVSTSDEFTLWESPDEAGFSVGSIVRHLGPTSSGQPVQTYGIVIATQAQTLGLDDLAVHVYETDARPPVDEIVPSPSRRRPVVVHTVRVMSSTDSRARPVKSGPVYAVQATEVLEAQGRYLGQPRDQKWLCDEGIVLAFYEDEQGRFGVFAEERARVLGPKQGHLILSGMPGAGKTSEFLTLVTGLYVQLQGLELHDKTGDDAPISSRPRVATLAFNVKGADLLFLDHLDDAELSAADRAMWEMLGAETTRHPFGRVVVYVPLAEDGLNRNSLRTNPLADLNGYSETREFALGIDDLWPHLDLLFDDRSSAALSLLAEVREYFRSTQTTAFTLANVLDLFDNSLRLPRKKREGTGWEHHALQTIYAVYGRLHALTTMLGGLVDHTGTGFGLDQLTDLHAYDLVVIDLERIMADPPDPELADKAVKIVTRYVLQRLTEAVTRGGASVDNVIVFADELNRLAPSRGDSGVGEYLAHLARTTRDRGVVLFGAGQFRSGINQDILKAAAVHYSMQTPDYELSDAMYRGLSSEFKSRLTQLQPGEVMLQFPSLRTPVFARFPRPFVSTGTNGLKALPPSPPLPLGECIAKRLSASDPSRSPRQDEVVQLVSDTLQRRPEASDDLLSRLREVEMQRAAGGNPAESAWEQFRRIVRARFPVQAAESPSGHAPLPDAAFGDAYDDDQ